MSKHLSAAALCALSACSSEPNHLGNPMLLPVSAVTTGIGNAAYNARRAAVKSAVTEAGPALLTDLEIQARLWQTAPVPPEDRAATLGDIAALPDPGSAQWIEAVTIAIMVRL
ncbi:hypothetical protein SAMN05421759_10292 [Roseivivax lentus]|uniref:Uncharacterized protein n=1 Tax=Roseivivax lentus TaxID=633194 RepID=A0A1N7KV14_9RHOB|nr:hypothetical protein [Roseivivax lentus]SIS65391.1 hypothetical protein SAMN05421759_10292 [Roseivivax lentus]